MKYIGLAILGFFGLFIGGLVLAYIGTTMNLISLPWLRFDSKVNMNGQVIQKTYNADNAIYNYEWFKERYEAIGAIDNKISNAQESLDQWKQDNQQPWDFNQQQEYSRLNSVVLGLKNQKEDLVAEYNARAKEVNRNIFQNNLPLYINL